MCLVFFLLRLYYLIYARVVDCSGKCFSGDIFTYGSNVSIYMYNNVFCLNFRWWNTALWSDFFNQFLNIKDKLPNVEEMRNQFQQAFFALQDRNCFMSAAAELNKLISK